MANERLRNAVGAVAGGGTFSLVTIMKRVVGHSDMFTIPLPRIAPLCLLFLAAPIKGQAPSQPRTQERAASQAESPDGADPRSRDAQKWTRMAFGEDAGSQIGQMQNLASYIDRFRAANIYDPVLAVFDVRALSVAGESTNTIALSGEVGLRWYKSGLEQMLRRIGFQVVSNTIRILPEDTLGTDAFAVATSASTTMRSHPSMSSEQVNAIPIGWHLRLLRASEANDLATLRNGSRSGGNAQAGPAFKGEWYLAQSSEGYIGFVRADQITRTDTYRLPDAVLRAPHEVSTQGGKLTLPGGAALYASADGSGGYELPRDTGALALELPETKYTRSNSDLTSQTILELSRPLMKTPYVWGGVTEEGIDCSGYTQYAYRTLGVFLPRDARPQSVVGRISAFGADVERDARAGDLVYFADETGRISHIGIALGGGRLIHSSGGVGVHECDYHEVSRSRPVGMLERVLYSRRVLH